MTLRTRSLLVTVAVLLASLLGKSSIAQAQTMSFSYYTDAILHAEAEQVFAFVSGYDNSSEWCNHNQWETYATFSTPAGYYDGWFSGLGASFSVRASDGDYTINTTATVYCNCISGTIDAGVNLGFFGVSHHTTFYGGCTPTPNGCFCPVLACLGGSVPTCGLGTFTIGASACTSYRGAVFGALHWGWGDYVCTVGWSWSATGPHWCT